MIGRDGVRIVRKMVDEPRNMVEINWKKCQQIKFNLICHERDDSPYFRAYM